MFFSSLPRFHQRSDPASSPIDLKFGGDFRDSLVFNLNGGDHIWSSVRSSFNPRIVPLFW